jgi:hypothetical protein
MQTRHHAAVANDDGFPRRAELTQAINPRFPLVDIISCSFVWHCGTHNFGTWKTVKAGARFGLCRELPPPVGCWLSRLCDFLNKSPNGLENSLLWEKLS